MNPQKGEGGDLKNYSQAIETFLFRKSWGEIFQALPDEKAGQLIKAIYAHVNGEGVDLKDAVLSGVFMRIAKEIDQTAFILATNRRL